MTAQEFWNDFKEIFKDDNKKSTAIEKWQSYSDYTEFILEELESVLSANNLDTSREYYRIDLIGYTNKRNNQPLLMPEYRFKNYKWDLEVAIEHENSSYSWLDELVKLLHISCPLRVMMGYIPLKWKDNHNDYFDKIYNSIKDLNAFNSVNKENFLVIIGDSECGGDKNKFCNYQAYIFNKDREQFERLN
ncbi:MAG: hypothetical protein VZQ61_05710 [Christensenellaceae bacterium]